MTGEWGEGQLVMQIRVSVKDKQIDVQCGDGGQTIKWLANAALCRYDASNGMELGELCPHGFKSVYSGHSFLTHVVSDSNTLARTRSSQYVVCTCLMELCCHRCPQGCTLGGWFSAGVHIVDSRLLARWIAGVCGAFP